MPLFKRQHAIRCYYCQTTITTSSNSPSFSTTAASGSSSSFDPNQFRCPHCGCWNRYNSRGEIIGDEPAMHDERLNMDSFSKRGSPDRNHLPSVHSSNNTRFFCHTCQTNQTLLVNLLSNYLPAPDDPSYDSRVAALPDYTASLQLRYPPVCPSCLPAVEEEIKCKDEMARTRALAGALKASNPRGASGKNHNAKQKKANLRSWRIRGILWVINLFVVLIGYTTIVLGYRIPPNLERCAVLSPFLAILSPLWIFWDPTYSLQKRSIAQGRKIRVDGRKTYIIVQSVIWWSRLCTSCLLFTRCWRFECRTLPAEHHTFGSVTVKQLFFSSTLIIEVIGLLLSYLSITIHKPAPIRLIDTSSSRALSPYPDSAPQSSQSSTFSRSQTPVPSAPRPTSPHGLPEPDLFATLSLSSNPIITNYTNNVAANPMFGKPSLSIRSTNSSLEDQRLHMKLPRPPARLNREDPFDDENEQDDPDQTRDQDAMDWEPLSPKLHRVQNNVTRIPDDGLWLRQQRFFPPEEPTGLEGLLMRTRLIDDDNAKADASHTQKNAGQGPFRWHWGWVYSASALPVFALVIALWINSNAQL